MSGQEGEVRIVSRSMSLCPPLLPRPSTSGRHVPPERFLLKQILTLSISRNLENLSQEVFEVHRFASTILTTYLRYIIYLFLYICVL